MHGGEPHLARRGASVGANAAPRHSTRPPGAHCRCSSTTALRGLRRALVNAAHRGPALSIRLAIGRDTPARRWAWAASDRSSGRSSMRTILPFLVLPRNAHEAALAQDCVTPLILRLHLKAMPPAAFHLEALLKPAVEALALVVGDDERAFASATELWTDFHTRTLGRPTMEISAEMR
jgi:hypothetical protein